MMSGASPSLERLRQRMSGYEAATDPGSLAAGREELLKDLQAKVEELSATREQYREAAAAVAWIQARRLLSDFREGNRGQAGDRLAAYGESREMSGKVDDFLNGARDLLKQEQAAFSAAAQRLADLERARRKRKILLIAAASTALILACAVGLAFLRPRARPPSALPVPAARAEPPGPPGIGQLRELGPSAFGRLLAGVESASRRETVLLELRADLQPAQQDLGKLAARLSALASLRVPDLALPGPLATVGASTYLLYPGPAGPPLAQALAGDRRLSWVQIKDLFRRIAQVIQSAHEQGAVHGGLSTHNILLCAGGTLRILELGLAEALRAASSKPLWAQPSGNLASLAPEQESNAATATPAGPPADVFALGAVLYELAAGRPAFPGPNFQAQKIEGRYAPVSTLRPDLPKDLDRLLAGALCPDPLRRLASPAAFWRVLGPL